ncbi:hypothetical protein [Paraburkholderia caribensis]|nr:hypothetical protein [Paraburkholderia caribensis]
MRNDRIVPFTETSHVTRSRNGIRYHAAGYALSRIEHYFNAPGSRR